MQATEAMNREARKISKFFTEPVYWGGEITTRGAMITELREDGCSSHEIQYIVAYQAKRAS